MQRQACIKIADIRVMKEVIRFMIPKTIQYCWYGGEKTQLAQNCIESWRRLLPGWQLCEWNEGNTDLHSCAYVEEAYAKGKYAFVADVVRLDMLVRHGGVYLDSDVELLRPLDALLDCGLFLGYESKHYFSTATIGALPGNKLLQSLLRLYQEMPHFPERPATINTLLTDLFFRQYPLERKSGRQSYQGIELYPEEVLCPVKTGGQIHSTDNTIAVHHFSGSWLK